MQALGDEEVEVPLQESGAEVKSNADGYLGSLQRTGYSVVFQRMYEVHGQMDGKLVDNASLLVIRVSPRVDSRKRRFKSFNITFTVELTKGNSRNIDPPEILSWEPAQEGAWYLKEQIITRTDKGELSANASGNAPGGVAGVGFTATKSISDEYKKRIIHKVSSEPFWGSGGEYPNAVTWKLVPAEDSDGIGDYMAVAMLIRRPRASKFAIKVDSTAEVGYFSDKWNGMPGHSKTLLGPFPGPASRDLAEQKKPPGVNEKNMQANSNENLLQTLAFVHVPEKVSARELYSNTAATATATATATAATATATATAAGTAANSTAIAATTTTTAKNTTPAKTDRTKTAASNATAVATNTAAAISPGVALNPGNAPAAAAPVSIATPSLVEVHGNSGNPRGNGSFASNHRVPPSFLSTDELKAHPLGTLLFSNSRAVRHRKIAALYQRLAMLHREEAEEAEAAHEEAYADEAERQENDLSGV